MPVAISHGCDERTSLAIRSRAHPAVADWGADGRVRSVDATGGCVVPAFLSARTIVQPITRVKL